MIYILIGIVVVLLSLIPTRKRKDLTWMKGYSYHRGKYTQDQRIGENSKAAITLAMADQRPAEIDVRITSDQELVVFHDASLLRMCGVDALVESLTLKEVQAHPLSVSQAAIPSLQEVLKLVGGSIGLIIEIKPTTHIAATCEALMAQLENYNGNYAICSFDPFIVGYFKKHYPYVIRGQIIHNFFKNKDLSWLKKVLLTTNGFNGWTRNDYLSLHYTMVPYYAWMRWLNGFICTWTISDVDMYKKIEKKVDHMIIEFINDVK